jgi:DNA transformation protein and related proteins
VPPPSADFITELFAEFGPVEVRRMFSGAGIFADGLMLGLVVDGVIFLKADEHNRPPFEQEGMGPFAYGKSAKRVIMSYWRMPDRLYDAPEELAQWAVESLAAARRSAEQSVGRKRRSPSHRRGTTASITKE